MPNTTALLPSLIQVVAKAIENNAIELTELDQAIGDGDHVTNLQRGIQALMAQSNELSQLDWQAALQKMGMTVMSSIGGASGSLYGTLFLAMSKNLNNQPLTLTTFADVFLKGVEAVKQRGKADKGEKTMLDVLIPVAEQLHQNANAPDVFEQVKQTAITGAESTRAMVATKGRASFLGERSQGHIDAGAKSSQVMICAIVDTLSEKSTAPP
ncbi:dihydroxyacetone kinase subunit DhaL [Methyloglobulus sp.]|uniref:dihydroxyacetone kinase subunit DhaL n=1 Tax=Methyloglobulus sp. TaxID=2518622 RepID=UPI0032B749E6